MFKRLLSFFCFIAVMAAVLPALANGQAVLPEPGVYYRSSSKGVNNGILSVFKLPDGRVFFDVYVQNNGSDATGQAAVSKYGNTAPQGFFAGEMSGDNGKVLAYMDFGAADNIGLIRNWEYPLIADKTPQGPVRLAYAVSVSQKGIELAPANAKFSTAQFLDNVEVAGFYVKKENENPVASPCLAAYAAERFNPNISRLAMTRSNVEYWDISRMPAGVYKEIVGQNPVLSVTACSKVHPFLETCLVAEDLSAVYRLTYNGAEKLSLK